MPIPLRQLTIAFIFSLFLFLGSEDFRPPIWTIRVFLSLFSPLYSNFWKSFSLIQLRKSFDISFANFSSRIIRRWISKCTREPRKWPNFMAITNGDMLSFYNNIFTQQLEMFASVRAVAWVKCLGEQIEISRGQKVTKLIHSSLLMTSQTSEEISPCPFLCIRPCYHPWRS